MDPGAQYIAALAILVTFLFRLLFWESEQAKQLQPPISEDWKNFTKRDTANEKPEASQDLFCLKYNNFFPRKTISVSNNDQPWISQKLQKLDS